MTRVGHQVRHVVPPSQFKPVRPVAVASNLSRAWGKTNGQHVESFQAVYPTQDLSQTATYYTKKKQQTYFRISATAEKARALLHRVIRRHLASIIWGLLATSVANLSNACRYFAYVESKVNSVTLAVEKSVHLVAREGGGGQLPWGRLPSRGPGRLAEEGRRG